MLNKMMLWGVTVLAVAFLFFPNYMKFFMSGGGAGELATNNPLLRTTTLSLKGMTCEGCSVLVEKAIKEVPGVLSVKVDYERKRAVVTSETCCSDPSEAVMNAIQEAGYRATIVETDTAGTANTAAKPQADCCEQPPPSARAEAKMIDPERQIVFTVPGKASPETPSMVLAAAARLAPVLERLDKIEGVVASSANHTGTMIRVTLKAVSEREKLAAVVEKELASGNRTPVRIRDDELQKTLKAETWREKERIRELSAIEFRKLALERVQAFSKSEKLPDYVAASLVKLAEKEWDRLAKAADVTEAKQSPDKSDWRERGNDFSKAFCEEAKRLLTGDQLNRLSQMLADCIDRLPVAEKR